MPQILVVDDEIGIRELLSEILSDEGFTVHLAEDAAAARRFRQAGRPDLVLLDIWMPDMDGVSLLKEWAANGQLTMPVIMMSGHATIDTAVEATRIGAVDFLEKPIALQKLLATIRRVLQIHGTARRMGPTLAAFSRVRLMASLQERLEKAAEHSSAIMLCMNVPNSLAELCARSLHKPNAVWIDGATVLNRTSLEWVNGLNDGLLFVADYTSLQPRARKNLLAIVPELHARRILLVLGTSVNPIPIPDGVILQKLSPVWIQLPSLGDHRDDIPELATYLLSQMVENGVCPLKRFSSSALNALRAYSWPGDFSELMEVIRNLALISPGDEISSHDVAYSLRHASEGISTFSNMTINLNRYLREAREEFERLYFRYHIEKIGGNMTRLAEISGLERTHLYRKLRQLGMTAGKRADAEMYERESASSDKNQS
ncbi:Transcriptional regulatory protein [Candidatus Ichthyocystis hellenicum]|uniref:Transcriptional regulatory protein n=1 Tax=Candidatus Ichthyocystis hellenicum TaxID=1561003 RepID=A0A0S4M343_9BURK|nr:Transcriptional regulatory protein [Candidatus Ichthyocystis hellenicum]